MASVPQQSEARKRVKFRTRPRVLVLRGPFAAADGAAPTSGGKEILAIDARLAAAANDAAIDLVCYQTNGEAALIEHVHAAPGEGVRFIVIDPAGLTHSSMALRMALSSVAIPFIEVHFANISAREPFRSEAAPGTAFGTITGLGTSGYELAVKYALHHVRG